MKWAGDAGDSSKKKGGSKDESQKRVGEKRSGSGKEKIPAK
jgi:hypothetical protein